MPSPAGGSRPATLEEALRDGLKLDKDTKNVPGSPPIFATILEKIDKAAVFIPDLTSVAKRENGELVPNPNLVPGPNFLHFRNVQLSAVDGLAFQTERADQSFAPSVIVAREHYEFYTL
jgi:hypothetical protein